MIENGVAGPEGAEQPECSIVMPCLNEAETLGKCIEKAKHSFQSLKLSGEVIVADNGSADGSQALARSLGARVVPVVEKGYGNALRGGIDAARGRYVIMGDSDDSYDFSAIEPFVRHLREGFDLVMGNRFKGKIMPGAMPWKHRWIGNPVLTTLGRLFFHSPLGDFHCGLRGFTKDAYQRMNLRTTGMEFASEMVIKSTLLGMRIAELPIVLYKDGRSRPPHLRSWRDGWRHLRFMLLFSPLWLFLIPGLLLFLIGLLAGGVLMGGPRRIGGVEFDVHTMLACSSMIILGYQLIVFGTFTKTFAISQGLHPPHETLRRFGRFVTLEVGLVAGFVLVICGIAYLVLAIEEWRAASFGSLSPRISMRQMIPAMTLLTLGIETVFASFFLSILNLGQVGRER